MICEYGMCNNNGNFTYICSVDVPTGPFYYLCESHLRILQTKVAEFMEETPSQETGIKVEDEKEISQRG